MRAALRRLSAAAVAVGAVCLTLVGAPSAVSADPRPAHHDGLDAAAFAAPPDNSRPTVLWFWNGTVTDELIDRQLADLRARGVFNAIIFPFQTAALQPTFLSEGWFEVVGHALSEAKQHGMHVWLFNDDYFPSGRAANLVVDGGTVGDRTYPPHPELAATSLARQQRTVTGPATVPLVPSGLDVADGRLVVDAALVQGVRILATGSEWSDYTVTAHRRSASGAAGLVVRARDERNGYLVDTNQDGSVNLYRQVDGAFTQFAGSQPISGFDAAAEHTVRVVVHGDTITVSIDGSEHLVAHDSAFATGTAGVRAVATQQSSYDDLQIDAASGDPLYRQTFDDSAALDDFRVPADAPHPNVVAASARPADATDASRLHDLTRLATSGQSWQAPAGTWTLDTFTAAPSNGSYLDLMSDEAVRRFMDAVPGEYYRRFPEAFGTTIRGFWDDEPVLAATPWSPSLPHALAHAGSSPGLALTGVFDDLGRDGRTLRAKYWHAVSDRFSEAYMHGQARWMDAHDVDYISNPLHDEFGPAGQVDTSGDMLKDNQWAQVPGTDVVFSQYAQGGRTLLPRWPASAAHQNGQSRVLLENFGAMGWQVTPDFMRSLIGAFAVRGINLDTYHAMWTDPDHVVYPPPFQQDNPWWHDAHALTTWTGRVMQLARGDARADTAVIVPTSAAEAWQHTPQAAEIDTAFTEANNALEDTQVDYDLLDEGALTGDPAIRTPAQVTHGALRVGRQRYRTVVLTRTPTIAVRAVRALTDFVRAGGTVLAVGPLPAEDVDGHDAQLRAALHALTEAGGRPGAGRLVRVASPPALGAAAQQSGVAAALLDPAVPDVRVLRLYTGHDVAFLVNNESGDPVRTNATLPVSGTPEVWDPRTGATATAAQFEAGRNQTTLPLRLDPYETLAVVFRHDARRPEGLAHLVDGTNDGIIVDDIAEHGHAMTARVTATEPGDYPLIGTAHGRYYAGTVQVRDPLAPIRLDGDWTRTLNEPGASPTTGPLGSWTETDPDFSGSAEYEYTVDVPAGALGGHRWSLDLGDVRDVADVTVNGTSFDPVLWAPYRLDVTRALHAGGNQVRVTVTNTLANAHGDPRPSGLLGPVALHPSVAASAELGAVGRDGAVAVHADGGLGVAPGQTVPTQVSLRRFGARVGGQVAVRASIDAGLSVAPASADVYVGRDATATTTLRVSAPPGTDLDSSATLSLTAAGRTVRVPVQVAPASRFGTASASSTISAGYPVESINDGDAASDRWAQGNGWNDATINDFPDWVRIDFANPAPIGRLDIDTLDSAKYAAAQYGLRDAEVELLVDGTWHSVGTLRDNTAGHRSIAFPAQTATAVRLTVSASNSGDYSRVIELTAYPR